MNIQASSLTTDTLERPYLLGIASSKRTEAALKDEVNFLSATQNKSSFPPLRDPDALDAR